MQKKYQDKTVVIEVVQIVIEMDDKGKQKQQRYAMSKVMANDGKDQTATCQSKWSPSGCREGRLLGNIGGQSADHNFPQ
jgi:hypothetical protein